MDYSFNLSELEDRVINVSFKDFYEKLPDSRKKDFIRILDMQLSSNEVSDAETKAIAKFKKDNYDNCAEYIFLRDRMRLRQFTGEAPMEDELRDFIDYNMNFSINIEAPTEEHVVSVDLNSQSTRSTDNQQTFNPQDSILTPESSEMIPEKIRDDVKDEYHSRIKPEAYHHVAKEHYRDVDGHKLKEVINYAYGPEFPNFYQICKKITKTKYCNATDVTKALPKMTTRQVKDMKSLGDMSDYVVFYENLFSRQMPDPRRVDLRLDTDLRVRTLNKLWDLTKSLKKNVELVGLRTRTMMFIVMELWKVGHFDMSRTLEVFSQGLDIWYFKGSSLFYKGKASLSGEFTFVVQLFNASYPSNSDFSDWGRKIIVQHFERDDVSSISQFTSYVEKDELKRLFTKAKHQVGSTLASKYDLTLPSREQVFTFDERNRSIFSTDDDVNIAFDMKGYPSVTVNIYELDLPSIYDQGLTPSIDLDLVGWEPTVREIIAIDEKQTDFILHHMNFTHDIFNKKRGVWIVDFTALKRNLRAIVFKGKLNTFTVDVGVGNHVFILDESGAVIKDGIKLRFGDIDYVPEIEKRGAIHIPYVASTTEKSLRVTCEDGYVEMLNIKLHSRSLQLGCPIISTEESFISQKEATILVHPFARASHQLMPIDTITEVDVSITCSVSDRQPIVHTFKNIDIDPADFTPVRFFVPDGCTSVETHVNFKYTDPLTKEETRHNYRKQTSLKPHVVSVPLYDIFLTTDGDGKYVASLLGVNAEPIMNFPVNVNLKSNYRSHDFTKSLRTDADGRIYLGELKHIQSVSISTNATNVEFQIGASLLSHTNQVSNYVIEEGEDIVLPINLVDSLFEGYWLYNGVVYSGEFRYLEDLTSNCVERLSDTAVRVMPPAVGEYIFRNIVCGVESRLVKITVMPRTETEFLLDGCFMASRVKNSTLTISRVSEEVVDNVERLTVELFGATPDTRLHIASMHTLPSTYEIYEHLAAVEMQQPSTKASISPKMSSYSEGRVVGDEEEYIHRRQNLEPRLGNTLPHPGALVMPRCIGEARNKDVKGNEGEKNFREKNTRDRERYMDDDYQTQSVSMSLNKNVGASRKQFKGFLASNAKWSFNHRIDVGPDDGACVSIPLNQLTPHSKYVFVVVTDFNTGCYHYSIYSTDESPKNVPFSRDLRVSESVAINPNEHFVESLVLKCERADIPDGIEQRTISRFNDLFAVLRSRHSQLQEFAFLNRWHLLDVEEKRKLLKKYFVTEVLFHLFIKDKPFFDAEIRPLLIAKPENSLLEEIMIGIDDLDHIKGIRERATVFNPAHLSDFEKILMRALTDEVGEFEQYVTTMRRVYERTKMPRSEYARIFLSVLNSDTTPPSSSLRNTMSASSSTPRMDDFEAKKDSAKLYQEVGATHIYQETGWHNMTMFANHSHLVRRNGFWLTFAEHLLELKKENNITSQNMWCFRSEQMLDLLHQGGYHDALFALALSDLDYDCDPASAKNVYHLYQLYASVNEPGESLIIANQKIMDPFRDSANDRKAIAGEIKTKTMYTSEITIYNMADTPVSLDVLYQMPMNAIPLGSTLHTRCSRATLGAYSTHTVAFKFYFPSMSPSTIFPAHVSVDGELKAFADPDHLNSYTVVDEFSPEVAERKEDPAWVFKFAPMEEKIAFMFNTPSHKWIGFIHHLYYHCQQSRENYEMIRDAVLKLHIIDVQLLRFCWKYEDWKTLALYISNTYSSLFKVGPIFESMLFSTRIENPMAIDFVEFAPYINARAHEFKKTDAGKATEFQNDDLKTEYRKLLNIMFYLPRPYPPRLVLYLCYYLILIDRVETAKKIFDENELASSYDRLNREEESIQLDYLRCYLDFSLGDLTVAREIAYKYVDEENPLFIKRWHSRFAEVVNQLKEIDEVDLNASTEERVVDRSNKVDDADDELNRLRELSKLSERTPSVTLVHSDEQSNVTLSFKNDEKCIVRLFPLDIETVFSISPFSVAVNSKDTSLKAYIVADTVMEFTEEGTHEIDLSSYDRSLLIQASVVGMDRSLVFHPSKFQTKTVQQAGVIRIRDGTKFLHSCYVKVYCRKHSGEVVFYKDGFTDRLGAFDYFSSSVIKASEVRELAILVISEEFGHVVVTSNPPTSK
ncbi:hypothetical protein PCE1_002939 [Barthelona sp. PCE]